MSLDNQVSVCMSSKSQNEAFARIAAAAFVTPLDPLLDEIADIKTAVSEAVTNAIIHGYDGRDGIVKLCFQLIGNEVSIEVSDDGIGIENIEQAMTALFTTKPEQERSGMGFTVMQTFMDQVEVISRPGQGTNVSMRKKLKTHEPVPTEKTNVQ